ncbi:MAG: hypothetical protein ACRECD_09075 [Burkholderiaceae bacterium]
MFHPGSLFGLLMRRDDLVDSSGVRRCSSDTCLIAYEAAESTRRWLEDGGLDRANTPMELREHSH